MLDKINNKLVIYSPELETYLIGLGFQPLSDRDRDYVEEFTMMVIENGRLLAPSHWHYGNEEIFFIDGVLIYEGDEYKDITNANTEAWNTSVREALKDEDITEEDLAIFIKKPI